MAQSSDLLSLINSPSLTPSTHLLNHLSYLLLSSPTLVPPPPPNSGAWSVGPNWTVIDDILGDPNYPAFPYPTRDAYTANLISKALRATQDFWATSIRIDTFSTNSTDSVFYLPSDTWITTSTNQ